MFGIRVFFGNKLLCEDTLKARSYTHACTLAEYVARTLAKESLPLWMYNPQKVSWVVLEPTLQVV